MDQDAPQGKYLRVAADLLARIKAGEFGEDGKIPTIAQIVEQYEVSKTTAQQAIATLSARGYVVGKVGAGTYVRPRPQLTAHIRLFDRLMRTRSPWAEEMEAQGRRGTWDTHTRTVRSTPQLQERLGVPEPPEGMADVHEIGYVYRADGFPAMIATSWEPLDLVRGTDIFHPEEGFYAGLGVQARMLAIGVRVTRVEEHVGARRSTTEESRVLALPAHATVLTIRRRLRAGERIVETADITLPADTFELVYSWEIDRPLDGD